MYTREEAKQVKIDFWNEFSRVSSKSNGIKGLNRRWKLHNTGLKGVVLKFESTYEGAFVICEVNTHRQQKRISIFQEIKKYTLIWDQYLGDGYKIVDKYFTPEGIEVSRLYLEQGQCSYLKQKDWPKIVDFFMNNMPKMEKALDEIHPIIENYIRNYSQLLLEE